MSEAVIVAIIGLISGLIGGGGGIAAYFKLRPENRRTNAEAKKLEAEKGKIKAETKSLEFERLNSLLEAQGKQINELQADGIKDREELAKYRGRIEQLETGRTVDRKRISELEAALDLAQRRINELIFILRRAGVQLPDWAANHKV